MLTATEQSELQGLLSQQRMFQLFPDEGPLRRELYPKHTQFFAAGRTHRVRNFRAANRCGKTLTVLLEATYHATGIYPHWWVGKRFDHPTQIWVAGESSASVRDTLQAELVDQKLIPPDLITQTQTRQAAGGALDWLKVRHISGGESTIGFMYYSMNRRKFQGVKRDVIVLDEQPPREIYGEALARTMSTDGTGENAGLLMMAYSPVEGLTGITDETDQLNVCTITAGWDDVPHLSKAETELMLAHLPEREHAARSQGVPLPTSGAVYRSPQSEYVIEPFPIPEHFAYCGAIDPGWNTFAALLGRYDWQNNVLYIVEEYCAEGLTTTENAKAIRTMMQHCSPITDRHSMTTSTADGSSEIQRLRRAGVKARPASYKHGVMEGISAVREGLNSGQIKIMSSCPILVNSMSRYRMRPDGIKPSKKTPDHLPDALRFIWMNRRIAFSHRRRLPTQVYGTVAQARALHG